jgi:hypothetical protein
MYFLLQVEYAPIPSVTTTIVGQDCVVFAECSIRAVIADPPRGINAGGVIVSSCTSSAPSSTPAFLPVQARPFLSNIQVLMHC